MATFLLEVGTEELPATFVKEAIAQWQRLIPAAIAEQSLTNEAINVYGTPRRLAVVIEGLPTQQSDREEEIKGPPAATAFKDGKPTKAAEGFAKKQGVEIDSLEIRPTDKGDFIFILKKIPGRPTADILAELIPQWISKLEGKRLMRWGDGELKFPRPIRWLVALLDDAILPITLVNGSETVNSDRISQGHRVLHPQPVAISKAENYLESLRSAYIEVDPEKRQTKIREQVEAAAKKQGGKADITTELLEEVTNLVEWPTAVVGKFDEEFLILPPEAITTIIVKNQRYFPILKSEASSELLPYFITISNGDPAKSDVIATGNGRVVRARLADGDFFYKADLAKPLESYLPQLEKVTFQENLGTVRDKINRFSKIANLIADQLQVTEEERNNIQRAALLCKADLVTQMVYEFPELQGIMGQKYALASGEAEPVATAIFEHYLPRGAGDILPQSLTGQVVALADKLDTLVSIFSLGMKPTGSSDPFALRRSANAVINITWAAQLPLDLYELIVKVVEFTQLESLTKTGKLAPPDSQSDEYHSFMQRIRTLYVCLKQDLSDFFLQRIRTLLQEEKGIDYDLVNAVLGENDPEYTERALQDLLDALERAVFLQQIRDNGTLDKIYETVNRSTRLAGQGDLDKMQLEPKTLVRPELFQKSSEQAFNDAIVQLVPKTQASKESRNYQQLVESLAEIAPAVSNFFDGSESVLVMDSNPEIKQNRLNLLGLLRNHARVLADFGQIVKG
ncbi:MULTISPECIES: glycine--tRNA ligase subunit beta [Kamptonema]|uniref:glycine--tRNA ligase subunit beta n=1 Tax=Kamptonema TaxID=1501433 RepID=UPI0001DAC74B|nr:MULTISPECIES: glycine--tRNA ligase subunit beta [Kamptonema]CBN58011.1 Glycyl-tRNA synthetase beta subunit [Kamptonema sp. PCC 6506]